MRNISLLRKSIILLSFFTFLIRINGQPNNNEIIDYQTILYSTAGVNHFHPKDHKRLFIGTGCYKKNLKFPYDSGSITLSKNKTFSVYYVGGKNASDRNPGTKKAPFATISKAASILKEGDTCFIRAGIYRETVVPKNSGSSGNPIVFTSDGGVDVIISGADEANDGWTVYSGNIYQKTIALPVTGYIDAITGNSSLLANQVFVDGKMMIEARWPNISNSDDLMNRADFAPVPKDGWISGEGTTLQDPDIPDIPGGWTGGTIWIIGWYVPGTSDITAYFGRADKIPVGEG